MMSVRVRGHPTCQLSAVNAVLDPCGGPLHTGGSGCSWSATAGHPAGGHMPPRFDQEDELRKLQLMMLLALHDAYCTPLCLADANERGSVQIPTARIGMSAWRPGATACSGLLAPCQVCAGLRVSQRCLPRRGQLADTLQRSLSRHDAGRSSWRYCGLRHWSEARRGFAYATRAAA